MLVYGCKLASLFDIEASRSPPVTQPRQEKRLACGTRLQFRVEDV